MITLRINLSASYEIVHSNADLLDCLQMAKDKVLDFCNFQG